MSSLNVLLRLSFALPNVYFAVNCRPVLATRRHRAENGHAVVLRTAAVAARVERRVLRIRARRLRCQMPR